MRPIKPPTEAVCSCEYSLEGTSNRRLNRLKIDQYRGMQRQPDTLIRAQHASKSTNMAIFEWFDLGQYLTDHTKN
eukprot:scaffold12215_cov78-Skeletonema_dohrnii-CCMP3373.AAC.2